MVIYHHAFTWYTLDRVAYGYSIFYLSLRSAQKWGPDTTTGITVVNNMSWMFVKSRMIYKLCIQSIKITCLHPGNSLFRQHPFDMGGGWGGVYEFLNGLFVCVIWTLLPPSICVMWPPPFHFCNQTPPISIWS